jgi:tRNA1(Val) A37 N6-methylase TrmN6
LEEGKKLIELGCGNGRYSVFFCKNNINVVAVDQVDSEIEFLNENYANENIEFVCDDFTNLAETSNETIRNTTLITFIPDSHSTQSTRKRKTALLNG